MAVVFDLLFPPRCAACGTGSWPLCTGCGARVAVVTPPLCARCGRPVEEPMAACGECPPPQIDAVRAPFLYDGPLARAIRALKFSGWRALGVHLAAAMAELLALAPVEGFAPDLATWVPLSGRRRAARGFDQAETLARLVAWRLDVPAAGLLARARDTPAQARRSARDRRTALRGAFVASARPPPSVLLVDDVFTTGATAAACAGALRRRGARRIVVLAAARAVRGPVPTRCYGAEGADRPGPI